MSGSCAPGLRVRYAALLSVPRHAALPYNDGMLLVGMGRAREAESPLREVIALAPDSPEAAAVRRLLPR